MYSNDKRIVLTLDAGGTNFVFSAIQGNRQIVEPMGLPAAADNLDKCLATLVYGFDFVKARVPDEPVAISFAFPGPADYKHGVIGDLPNFPSFRGGVALGPFLQRKYGIPVFIENDGNLFAYGEAISGVLPEVNRMLAEAGATKRYRNLLGITLGTGFGAGVVIDGKLLTGDNGCGGDVWLMRNKKYPDLLAEESVSIRAVRRVYAELSGENADRLTPKDIFDIAEGLKPGNREAAAGSFRELGEMAGCAIASALDIVDGLVVIGGGLAGAAKYILPALTGELKSHLGTFTGLSFPCLQAGVFNWENELDRMRFLTPAETEVVIPDSGGEKVVYDQSKRIAVLCSRIGASCAIMRGAYAYALASLDCGR